MGQSLQIVAHGGYPEILVKQKDRRAKIGRIEGKVYIFPLQKIVFAKNYLQ